MPRFTAAFLLAIAASFPVSARPPRGDGRPPPAAPSYASTPLPVPATARSDFLDALATHLAGRRAIVVDPPAVSIPLPPATDGEGTAAVMADLAAALGTPARPLTAMRAGTTTVLAPPMRDEVDADVSGRATLDATGPAGLWIEAMAMLPKADIAALGSEDGAAMAALPAEARERLRRALRPPLVIRNPGANGATATLTQTPDPDSTRIRARLREAAPMIWAESDGHGSGLGLEKSGPEYRPPGPRLEGVGGGPVAAKVALPGIRRVSNALKPSDLRATEYRQAAGVTGAYSVAALLQALEKTTGLRLAASAQYAARPVVVGSADIPAGDILDGLCLALTASWRKMGDLYFLTWDRRGLGALQEGAREVAAVLTKPAARAVESAGFNATWPVFAVTLPFAADDPLALTHEQRAAMFAPVLKGRDHRGIPYAEMTPAQQAVVRRLVVGKVILVPSAGGQPPVEREGTAGDLARVFLSGDFTIEYEVRLPGLGWVQAPSAWLQSFSAGTIRMMPEPGAPPAPPASDLPSTAVAPRQFTLGPARRRGILTPVLPAEALEPVADLMRLRGFQTLYYPVLTDGRATVPTDAFPPHPAGAGFLEARRLLAVRGVEVVGYLETLAWRRPGAEGHWLEEHPDWLERDILGRPFGDSVAGQFGLPAHAAAQVTGDLVLAGHAKVARRLEALVRDYAALPHTTGILFDAWSGPTTLIQRAGYGSVNPTWSITRGFATTARRDAVQRVSIDPVDLLNRLDSGVRPEDVLSAPGAALEHTGGTTPEDRALLARLAAIRPGDGRGWRTEATTVWIPRTGEDASEPPMPVDAGVLVGSDWRASEGAPRRMFRVEPLPRQLVPGSGVDLSTPLIAIPENYMRFGDAEPLDLAIYDFRAAPEALVDSLRRVGLPPRAEETR